MACEMKKRSLGAGREAKRLYVACTMMGIIFLIIEVCGCQRHLWGQPLGAGDQVQQRPAASVAESRRSLRDHAAYSHAADTSLNLAGQSSHQPVGQPEGLQDHGVLPAAVQAANGSLYSAGMVSPRLADASMASAHSTATPNLDRVAHSGVHSAGQPALQLLNSSNTIETALNSVASASKQVCAGYLLGIGTTKGGTTSLWGLLRGWANSPFHPHLLAPADVGSKELYWWMHSDPYATLKEYDATLQKVVHPPKEVQQEWQQLFSLQSSQLFTCPAPEYKVMRAPPSAFKWINNVNGTAVDQSKLTRLYRADVTPEYMYDPRVPARVRALLPEARMVVLLRDPVTRTISEWAMNWLQRECGLKSALKHASTEQYKDAWQDILHERVAEGISTYQGCYEKTLEKSRVWQQEFSTCLGYDNPYTPRFMQNALPSLCASGVGLVGHSVYVDQLERWFELFPASQFKIWVSEDFLHDPNSHMLQLVDWLGLDPTLTSPQYTSGSPLHTKLHVGKYESQPASDTMSMLREFYAPHNERLFKLLEAKGFGGAAARMREVWGTGVAGNVKEGITQSHATGGATATVSCQQMCCMILHPCCAVESRVWLPETEK